jgi:1-deoxy-D-xylulose-5-phosphate reductoisomerase
LNLAYEALRKGDGYPTVLNAANEVAVEFFLAQKMSFDQIPDLVREAMENFVPPEEFDLPSILRIDQWARRWCKEKIITDVER